MGVFAKPAPGPLPPFSYPAKYARFIVRAGHREPFWRVDEFRQTVGGWVFHQTVWCDYECHRATVLSRRLNEATLAIQAIDASGEGDEGIKRFAQQIAQEVEDGPC